MDTVTHSAHNPDPALHEQASDTGQAALVERVERTEQEVKLSAPAEFELPEFDAVIPGLVAVPRVERELRATYFDTADLRLTRAGIAVRYRTGEVEPHRGVWTVKLPVRRRSSRHLTRREIEVEGDGQTVPEAVANLVRARARSAPLEPVAMVITRRRTIELRDDTGRLRVEIDDDHVTVLREGREIDRFREVEVELAEGAPSELLATVVNALRAAGARPGEPVPKVVRALGAAALEPPDMAPPSVGKTSPMATVVAAAVATSYTRLVDHDPWVRLGEDPEDVHQARVATRRLRSDLRTLQPLLDETTVTDLRIELKWLGAALGRVRDADVLLEHLRADVTSLDDPDRSAGTVLVDRLHDERAQAHRELLNCLDSARYVELLDALVGFNAAPTLKEDSDRPARTTLPRLVAHPWRRLLRAVSNLPDVPSDDELHQLRIRTKRVRYAAELASAVVGKPAARFARALAAMQDDLGEIHDAVVAEQWLRTTSAHVPGPAAFAAGLLVISARARKAEGYRRWRPHWRASRRKKLVRWLT